jgi:hypothetical protein
MNIGSRKKSMEALDHHDLPTEPIPLRVPTLLTETLPGQADPFDYTTIPVSSSYTPIATTNVMGYPPIATGVAGSAIYPNQNSPREEESGSALPNVWQMKRIIPFGLIPFGVGMCFVSIQILLLVRFTAKVCNLSTTLPWVRTVYTLSDVVLLPLYTLLPPLTQAFFTRIEPYTLLAIVLYGLCSRVIVRLLKLLLRMRFLSA